MFSKLLAALKDVQQGKVEDKFGWLELVRDVENIKYRDDKMDRVSNDLNGFNS